MGFEILTSPADIETIAKGKGIREIERWAAQASLSA